MLTCRLLLQVFVTRFSLEARAVAHRPPGRNDHLQVSFAELQVAMVRISLETRAVARQSTSTAALHSPSTTVEGAASSASVRRVEVAQMIFLDHCISLGRLRRE